MPDRLWVEDLTAQWFRVCTPARFEALKKQLEETERRCQVAYAGYFGKEVNQ